VLGRSIGLLKPLIDDVYQEEQLATSFVIESYPRLHQLVGDANDIQTLEKQKWKPIKKKV
jgi:hypothetical protein